MALIKLGSTVAMIAGSIGGATYARNRYGAYIRNRTKPVDPGSNRQTEYRTRVSAAVAAWRALTDTQRLAFNDRARSTGFVNRIGESFAPSGINLFVRTYNLLDIAGLAQVTAPPISPIIADGDAYIRFEVGAGLGLMHHSTISDWPSDATMCAWYTYNLTNSTYFYKGPWVKFSKMLGAEYTDDEVLLRAYQSIDEDSSMSCMWRLIGTDGAASHARISRAIRPPAA